MQGKLENNQEKSYLAMPCYGACAQGEGLVGADASGRKAPLREHEDLIASLGDTSEGFVVMIHTAIPVGKIWSIPKAKESVEAEWTKLHK